MADTLADVTSQSQYLALSQMPPQNLFQQNFPCSQNQPTRVDTLVFVLPVLSAEERQMARHMIPSSHMAQETLVVYFTAPDTSQLNRDLVHQIFSMLTSPYLFISIFKREK